ncbi:LacI family transcriptional regulator [Salibacterium salarium]|uniref:LacI family transcriptional regulator n=1 Tax=Salibacterium salarium TaxID=284579 RepID=A0A428N5E6_9BACI|nr:LacI family DNA-binding transcriptional regulator [Salibacterium salarium]RSL33556.1 LacI family transcriptional regulator [Salibacterium salarium]
MTSMKEVARKADVSVATVSAVVNNSKYVSEELRHRIETAIHELDYRPNRFAQGLKGKETKLVGVTVTEITNPFYPSMLEKVEEMAYERGYNLILSTTGDDEEKETKLLESMIDLKVDGIILSTVDNENSKTLDLVKKENIPYVLINRAPAGYNDNMVCVDSFKVGELAAEHLISLNHRSIAFFGGDRQNSIERKAGFQSTMKANGIEVREDFLVDAEYDLNKAYKKAVEIFAKKQPPTAIFAASDEMAYGVTKAYLDYGYSVPGDISIIGSDNAPFSGDFRVPLTTIDVHGPDIGAQGFELLESKMARENQDEYQRIIVEPELIIRESTAYL